MLGTTHSDRAAVADAWRSPPRTPEALVALTQDLARSVLGVLADAARAADLNQNDYMALVRVVAADGMVPADLKHILGISAGSMSELADRLEARGLITRVSRPGRRRVLLRPTLKGRRTVDHTLGPVLARVLLIAEDLDPQPRATVGEFLSEVARGLSTDATTRGDVTVR